MQLTAGIINMKICTYLIRELPDALYQQLYSLNMRERGLMRDSLVAARHCKHEKAETYHYEAICMMEGDLVISWCLYMPSQVKLYARKLAHYGAGLPHHIPVLQDKVVSVYFWTRAAYRGKGHGKTVGTFAAHYAQKNGFGVCKVAPWDKKSRILMESLEKTSPLPVME